VNNIAYFSAPVNADIAVASGNGYTASIGLGDNVAGNDGGMQYNNTTYKLGFVSNGIGDRMVIDSSGNVGIGTSVPQAKLDVEGSVYVGNGNVGIGTSAPVTALEVRAQHVSGQGIAVFSGNTDAMISVNAVAYGYQSDIALSAQGAARWYISRLGAPLHNFRISGDQGTAFTIAESSNNIGIGSSDPQAKLDVVGAGTTSATASLVIRDSAKTAKVTVLDNGNVGIGTSVPQYKLHVSLEDAATNNKSPVLVLEHTTTGTAANGMGSSILFMAEQANGTSWGMSTINSIYTDATAIDTALTFETRLGGDLLWERMRISANGNVGIGTTAQTARLDLVGSGTTSATAALVIRDSALAAKVTVLDNGNIGIGTTAPASILDVQSAITATSNQTSAVSVTPTVTAHANFDTMYGLRVTPTFSDGAFAPTQRYAISGWASDASSNNDTNYGVYGGASNAANAAKTIAGVRGQASSGSSTADTLYGGMFVADTIGSVSSGTRNVYGVYALGRGHGAMGGTDNVYGMYSSIDVSDGQNTSNAYGVYTTPSVSESMSGVANIYGLYAANGSTTLSGGATAIKYGLYIEAQTGATNNYGAYIGSNVGIGTSAPLTKMDVKGQYRSIQVTTTTTLDWNNGNVQYIQLASGGQTFTFANPQGGARYMLILKQPGSGGAGSVTWPAEVLWPGGAAPVLTGSNNKADVITFVYDSTNSKYYAGSSLNY
jgi:hypothetical protein